MSDVKDKKYHPDFVKELVKANQEGETFQSISDRTGIPASTISYWKRKAEGKVNGNSTKVKDKEFETVQVILKPADDNMVESNQEINSDYYIRIIDFNSCKPLFRELENIAETQERTIEQQIRYICKRYAKDFK